MEKIIRIRRLTIKRQCCTRRKNAAVAIIPATLLAQGTCILENVPRLQIYIPSAIFFGFGQVQWLDATTIKLTPSSSKHILRGPCRKIACLYYFMGALLGRRPARTGMPGVQNRHPSINTSKDFKPWAMIGM